MDKNLGRLERMFPPRQVLFKSHGDVRYFTLSPLLQKVLAVSAIAAFGWVAYASFNTVFRTEILDAKNAEIEALELESAEKSEDILTLQTEIIDRTDALETRQGYLKSLIENDPTGTVPGTEEEETDPEMAEPKRESFALPSLFFKSANAAIPPDPKGAIFLKYIRVRLSTLEENQARLAIELNSYALAKLAEFDLMLAPFKVTAEDLARSSHVNPDTLGQGGPYVPPGKFSVDIEARAFDDLQANWAYLQAAYSGFKNIPLTEPVKEFYLSSRFGKRKDPITQEAGWHPGIDLAGWPGTKIYAPTSGIVTKAGTWGGYGQMVEIDHGNGFKTRYAHLRKVIAKRGQAVKPGDVVGEMGCTGRCVSTHLHYEVYFNGILRNPQPFMEAPEDVQQTQANANGAPHNP